MPSYIVKLNPEEDIYVYWSTVVEAPLAWGTREEMFEHLKQRSMPNPYRDEGIEARLQRADTYGTSAFDGDYDWGSTGLIYMQKGVLDRFKLKEFLESFDSDTQEFDLTLLRPFEDG